MFNRFLEAKLLNFIAQPEHVTEFVRLESW